MTAANSADQPQDDLVPAQEKLEWVTPKISQMGSGDTLGKTAKVETEQLQIFGPS
jgi:hypothetical protein